MATPTKVMHFLLRLDRSVRTGSSKVDVIDAHNQIVERMGRVGLGKFGMAPSEKRCRILQEQTAQGRRNYLYLSTKSGAERATFRAPIKTIIHRSDNHDIAKIVPSYYDELPRHLGSPSIWFVVAEPFAATSLEGLLLASNSNPAVDIIMRGRTTLMMVYGGPS